MTKVLIDTSKIKDWDSFHDVFVDSFGFPDFYGRNMNAWIDCMSSLDCPDDGMTSVHCSPGSVVTLELSDATDFASRCPELYEALVECSAFVNYRLVESGASPVLALSYWKKNT